MRRRFLTLIVLLLLAKPVAAQVAFDAASNDGGSTFASGSTFAHTVSGSNRFLLVSCTMRAMSLTGVTYNSVAMTFETREDHEFAIVEIWKLVAPATGTHNVVVTASSTDVLLCFAASFTGVDQGTPIGTSVRDSGTDTSHAHDTTNQASGMVWDAFATEITAGTISVNGGQTTRVVSTDAGPVRMIATTKAGATTVNSGYSWTSADYFAHATVPMNPVAASPPATRGTLMLLGVGP